MLIQRVDADQMTGAFEGDMLAAERQDVGECRSLMTLPRPR